MPLVSIWASNCQLDTGNLLSKATQTRPSCVMRLDDACKVVCIFVCISTNVVQLETHASAVSLLTIDDHYCLSMIGDRFLFDYRWPNTSRNGLMQVKANCTTWQDKSANDNVTDKLIGLGAVRCCRQVDSVYTL